MKALTKGLLGVTAVLVAGLVGSGVAAATTMASGQQQPPEPKPSYSANEAGQTLGTPIEGAPDPDLIFAQGKDGQLGYVRAVDLNGPEFDTIEETLRYQEQYLMSEREIPLYASDGKTVIGSFLVSAAEIASD